MRKLLTSCTASLFLATGAMAAPIGFGFNAGSISSISDPEATGVFNGFLVGENLFINFTLDDATPDTDPTANGGRYFDPAGTLNVRGLTSNTMLTLELGVEVDLDDPGEFELDGDVPAFNDTDSGLVLEGDIDLDTNEAPPLVSDPNDLSQSIADLSALLNPDGVFTGITNQTDNIASLSFFIAGDGNTDENAILSFGTVPTAPVPLPAGAWLLLSGLLGLGAARRITRSTA